MCLKTKPREPQLNSGEKQCMTSHIDMKRFEWCPEVESNHRHKDFQSFALPTELSGQLKKKNYN